MFDTGMPTLAAAVAAALAAYGLISTIALVSKTVWNPAKP
jgi:hypothetical protein